MSDPRPLTKHVVYACKETGDTIVMLLPPDIEAVPHVRLRYPDRDFEEHAFWVANVAYENVEEKDVSDDYTDGFAHPGLTHRNGDQCILLEDGTWFKPYDVGGEGVPCPNPEHETEIPHLPQLVAWETIEYGVERSWPQWNDGKPVIGVDGVRRHEPPLRVHPRVGQEPVRRQPDLPPQADPVPGHPHRARARRPKGAAVSDRVTDRSWIGWALIVLTYLLSAAVIVWVLVSLR